jgi:hypothetical protein
MRGPKKRMPGTNAQYEFDTYLAAHRRAFAWAERALIYRSAGKFARAKAAVERVNHWMREIALLVPEPPYSTVAARPNKRR